MMGYITVPKLEETLPIYHGTSEKVLQSGIGHLEQTSLPVGGASTHAALSGHRGLPTAKLFTDLNLMKKGDKFYITILKDTGAPRSHLVILTLRISSRTVTCLLSQTVQITNHIHHGGKDRADMLDLHSGSEYGAARIAAMIAAAVTIVLTVLAAFGSMVPYAQADSFGALTINAVWGRDTASPKLLAGDTYSIVRIATVTTNNDGSVSSYKTVGDFSGLTADWERLTSSEYHDAAKKLAAHAAKNKLYQHSGTTNVAGQLTFQNLPLGLYLVSRTSSAKANKAYDCDPFLISIPGSGGTSADLNITVEPKFSTGTPVVPPEDNPSEEPGNPGLIGRTGAAVGSIAGKSHTDDLFVCENNAPKSPLLAALPKHHVESNTWS